MRNFRITILAAILGCVVLIVLFMGLVRDMHTEEDFKASLEEAIAEETAKIEDLRAEISSLVIPSFPEQQRPATPSIPDPSTTTTEPPDNSVQPTTDPDISGSVFSEEEILMVKNLNAIVLDCGEYAANYQNDYNLSTISDAERQTLASSMRDMFDGEDLASISWYYYGACTWVFKPCLTQYIYEVPALWEGYDVDTGKLIAVATATWNTTRGCFSDLHIYSYGTSDLIAPVTPGSGY